jgi:hypothetical protein
MTPGRRYNPRPRTMPGKKSMRMEKAKIYLETTMMLNDPG